EQSGAVLEDTGQECIGELRHKLNVGRLPASTQGQRGQPRISQSRLVERSKTRHHREIERLAFAPGNDAVDIAQDDADAHAEGSGPTCTRRGLRITLTSPSSRSLLPGSG